MFENEDESPTVLTDNIIKYSYLLYISSHISESSSDIYILHRLLMLCVIQLVIVIII